MLKIDTRSLEKVSEKHGLSAVEIEEKAGLISDYLAKIEARDQGFHKVIDNEKLVREIEKFAGEVNGKYDDVIVLGIGGSALGTICLQQSLKHLFENEMFDEKVPKLHVLDNIDPALIREIEDVIDYERTLFIVATKSGGTPETLSQYFYFRKQANEMGLEVKEHFVFVTDSKNGLLRRVAQEEGIRAFEIPENVGGRFSVLTAVGLLPAKLIGIDVNQLLAGAREMRDKFLSADFKENLPFQVAVMQYLLGRKGKIMNVVIPYSHRLIRFADWYRQLLAESIGKAQNEAGETVNVGLTPINALGVTDQHSQSQLYNEGPNDKFFIFIEVENLGPKVEIPNLYPDDPAVLFLKNVDFGKLLNTEKKGTEQALTQNDRPNVTVKIDEVNPKSLGELFLLFEGATSFLGEFYQINAFDQPGVELSKDLTKRLLLEEA